MEDAKRFLDLFRRELSEPEYYLEPCETLRCECLAGVKLLFSCLKLSGGALPTGPLQQVYTEGFDEDQVWEEVQLTNEPALQRLCAVVEGLGAELHLVAAQESTEEEERERGDVLSSGEEGEEGVQSTGSEVGEDEEEARVKRKVVKGHQRSEVEDEFFNLSDMEQYLEEAEQLSELGTEGSVGALAEELSDSNSDELHYQDFFDPPLAKGRGEGVAIPGEQQQLSTYERRQQKLASQIQAFEVANVQQKSWQMSGEASSRDRPLNSLLEEAVDFDPMMAPLPVVTEETTCSVEDIIRRRILDQAWDDVQRKIKPPERPYDYQRARPLNQEKSKRSLAEIYEDHYVKQTEETTKQIEGVQQEREREDPRHAEVEELKKTLFLKLDALSNFHFTPKPPLSEVHVVSNVSAVAMEEVTPSITAQHTLLAPEEIQTKTRAPEKGVSERTTADRRRQRVAKKRLKRRRGLVRKPLLAQLKGSGARGWKVLQGKQRGLSSSRYFFASLQQQAKTHVAGMKERTPHTTATKSSVHFLL